jgi:DNA-binding response OmpR family regulator
VHRITPLRMAAHTGNGGGGRCRGLLIEADETYAAAIGVCMELAGCRVEHMAGPDAALAVLDSQRFDVVVWGVWDNEEDRRGEVISEVRLRTEAPLVLVDGSSEMARTVLETGADQWVPKPFVPGTLIGSVRAALRKSVTSVVTLAARMEIRGMVLDGRTRSLSYDGRRTALTRQEWELLSVLVSHPDRFLSAREILGLGWRAGEHASEQLRTYVSRLRQKLEPLGLPCRLLSQHGQGYCLTFDRGAPEPPALAQPFAWSGPAAVGPAGFGR